MLLKAWSMISSGEDEASFDNKLPADESFTKRARVVDECLGSPEKGICHPGVPASGTNSPLVRIGRTDAAKPVVRPSMSWSNS